MPPSSGPRAGRRTNAEWSAATQAALLTAARTAFRDEGFEGASIDRIAAAAKVTKGAVYHHYRDKRALFEAVFVLVEGELVARIERAAMAAADPFDALTNGCDTFLDVVLGDDASQIVLVDGPRVLGWHAWHVIDAQLGGQSLRLGLQAAVTAGALVPVDVSALATLISGGLNEAALTHARRRDAGAEKAIRGTLRQLLRGLRPAATRDTRT